MKVARTELNESEYRLLRHYTQTRGITLKEALREATRLLVLSDKVDRNEYSRSSAFFQEPERECEHQ